MKDDHLQGILFSSSPRVQVVHASASQRLLRRAKSLAGYLALPSGWTLPRRDTATDGFIDHSELSELLSRFRH